MSFEGNLEKKPTIAAKTEGIGLKVYRADDGSNEHTKAQPPADRHYIRKVDESTVKKDKNSVIASSVNIAADVADIRAGKATKGRTPGGEPSFTINGRTYGMHANGTLYPISGVGIFELDRGAFMALALYNKFPNDRKKAEGYMDKIGLTAAQKAAALAAHEAG